MGKIELDHTGAGSGITLSSDGTDLLLDGTAIGGGGASALTIDNKTAAYTVVADDLGKIINCSSGTFTVSLTAAATLGSGFNCWIWNTGTGTITIDPNGSETVEDATTVVLSPGQGFNIVCTGTSFIAGDQKTLRLYSENIDNGFALRPLASGTGSVAIGSQSTATAAYSIAFRGNSTIAYGTAIGANSSNQRAQAVTGSGAMALGGSYASGTDSFAAAIANNTSSYGATGANSVAIGQQAKATNGDSIALGYSTLSSGFGGFAAGYDTTASGAYAISIGRFSSSSNTGSVALGDTAVASGIRAFSVGYAPTASGDYSVAIGSQPVATEAYSVSIGKQTVSNITGKYAYSAGRFGSNGDAQTGTFVLRSDTTDATPEALTTDNSAAGTTDQIILPNNSAYAFHGTIVARQQASAGTACAAWKIEGLIRREGSAGTTVLVNSATTVLDNTPAWGMALSADTTNGGLEIEVTGAAATNIRWVATINTSEVTY